MTARDDIPAATQREIKRLWVEHGGGQHGPRVETYTIPEEAFWRFMSAALASRPAPHEADRDRAAEEERIREDERDRLFEIANQVAKGKVADTSYAEQMAATTVALWLADHDALHRCDRTEERSRAALRSRTPAPSCNQDGET